MSANLSEYYIVTSDGAFWDMTTDTAPVPTGTYGNDWAVIHAYSREAAKRSAWGWDNEVALPTGCITEAKARALFAARETERGNNNEEK